MPNKPTLPDKNAPLGNVSATVDVLPSYRHYNYSGLNKLVSPVEAFDSLHYLPDEIKKMMMRDSQVYASVMIWKTAVLVDGIQVTPAVGPDDRRYKKAKQIADFCRWCLENITGSFHVKILQLLDCCVWGHKAAVKIFEEQEYGQYKGKTALRQLRVVPNRDYIIKVDNFNKFQGLQSVNDYGNDEKVIRKEKFAFAIFRPEDDNPLGTNILFPAYSAYYDKMMIKPERMKNAIQFGSPSFWAEAPASIKETPLLDATGKPIVHEGSGQPVMVPINIALTEALKQFQGNGSGIVLPNTSKLNLFQAQGDGRVFSEYQNDCNMEIAKAILLTTLYTEQNKDGTNRASSQTGKGTVQLTVGDGKFMIADLIEEQLFLNGIMELNYPRSDHDLVPKVTLGNPKGDQLVSLYNAIAALFSVGFFDSTQRAELCTILGLPAPDPDAPAPKLGQPTGNVVENNNDKNKEEKDESDN